MNSCCASTVLARHCLQRTSNTDSCRLTRRRVATPFLACMWLAAYLRSHVMLPQ